MSLRKSFVLLPSLIVVAAWTSSASAQGTTDLLGARASTDTVIEAGGPSRVMLPSGILTFGSADLDAAVVPTANRSTDAALALGPFTFVDSLLNPEKVAMSRSSLPKPTIRLSPAALGAGGYGMLATATF
jgi:hypothetical protein